MLQTDLRRLPVLNAEGTLLGMLSRADLLQIIAASPIVPAQASSGTQSLQQTSSSTSGQVQQQPVIEYVNTDVSVVGEQAALSEDIDTPTLATQARRWLIGSSMCPASSTISMCCLAFRKRLARAY
jgi:CBS-domain-containing membrane protein